MTHRPLSVLTGGSSGIGLERARLCAQGRILVTGSIAGLMPGSCQAVCSVTKAYLDSFSFALRDEVKGSGA
ncbi:MAG: hypothetical protein ACU0A5_04730 [Salipiger marinus]|uniref:hypothetical protein n=1 Tax=Salipiger marinus TaxID=555512 RepID=UPI004057F6F7